MEEEQNSGTLEGTTEPTVVDAGRVFVNTGQNFPVQKNAAAKVIGILVIIYSIGIFGFLVLDSLSLSFMNEEIYGYPNMPITLFLAAIILAVIPTIIGCIGGWKMYNYQKMGIWLVFGSLIIGWIFNLFNSAFTASYRIEGTGDPAIDAAFNGICGIFCMAICGVIVAIPLMLADGGME